MIGFYPEHLIVKDLENGLWELQEPLFYDHHDGRSWMVPRKQVTDFGSVPLIVDWFIPASASIADRPYVLHDYLYFCNRHGYSKCRSRKDADDILYFTLRLVGVDCVRSWLIYRAVRLAGGGAWG